MHTERIIFEEKARKSKLVVQIGRDMRQATIVFNKLAFSDDIYGALYKQKYNLILNNLGFQEASITSWDIMYKSHEIDTKTGKNYYGKFLGMNPKFYQDNGSEVNLPLSVKPHQPIKLSLEIAVRIPLTSWNAVSNVVTFDKEYSYHHVEKIFNDCGYLQFGQLELKEISHGQELSRMAYGPGILFQEYSLLITKGSGEQVKANFSHNINDFFIQGENDGTGWDKL